MSNYRMCVAYEGTAYAGWQVQPGEQTIQGVIEQALHTITREQDLRVHSSGRTDRGVHARAQIAHFTTRSPLSPRAMQRALNALLPRDIRIMHVHAASPAFHARFSALSKEYRYCIWNGPVLPPFLRTCRHHERGRLNHRAMQQAARLLEGQHDFAAFTAEANRPVETTVRTLDRLQVRKRGHELTLCARADGFLYKMVRSLAGGLLRVGRGELSVQDIARILQSRTRTAHIPTAPPQGLFLWSVHYPPEALQPNWPGEEFPRGPSGGA